jgi:predicted dehydrogenase
MLQEFTDCVLGRRKAPRAGIAEALATFAICDAIEASIASGQVVCCAR